MPRPQYRYSVWLVLLVLGIALDTLGFAVIGPHWLRYGLIACGLLLIFVSIALLGRMQRSQ
jgi:hypothetical protein